MKSFLSLVLSVALPVVSLMSCSSDEPTQENVSELSAFEKVCGDKTWVYSEVTFIDGEGHEFAIEPIFAYVGGYYGFCFDIQGDKFNEYGISDAYAEEVWYVEPHAYTFDRESGYIYLDGSADPYARVVSVEEDKMVIDAHFGKFIAYGDIDIKVDKGSYARFVMVPADDSLLAKLPK